MFLFHMKSVKTLKHNFVKRNDIVKVKMNTEVYSSFVSDYIDPVIYQVGLDSVA